MSNKMTDRYLEKEQRKTRMRSIILLSLILHLSLVIVYVLLPLNMLNENPEDSVAFDFYKDDNTLQKRQNIPKRLNEKHRNLSQELAKDAEQQQIDAANNDRYEVIELSDRVVMHDVENNNAPIHDFIPDLMTDAKLRDAEASNLRHLVSQPGPIDGKGRVSDRVRVPGRNGGIFPGHKGKGPPGGPPGNEGTPPLPPVTIEFPKDPNSLQNVVYCLDISASMQAAGLNKLELALTAIKNSVLMLDNKDTFNIVPFSTTADLMSEKLIPANDVNTKRAWQYLDSFTPESIQENVGTNILAALEEALTLDSSVIVLVTDGLPTAIEGHSIETNTQKILDTVRAKNRNNASIYVVALEIDLQRSPGAHLLISLAHEHNGQLKVVSSEQLRKYGN